MTTQDYEKKYLGKMVAYDVSTKRTVYGRVDSINRETAFGGPQVIFKIYRGAKLELCTIDEEYFADSVRLLDPDTD